MLPSFTTATPLHYHNVERVVEGSEENTGQKKEEIKEEKMSG